MFGGFYAQKHFEMSYGVWRGLFATNVLFL